MSVAASGAVFVDRKNRSNAQAAMAEAAQDMKRRGVSPHLGVSRIVYITAAFRSNTKRLADSLGIALGVSRGNPVVDSGASPTPI
jgi:hypothetical protein